MDSFDEICETYAQRSAGMAREMARRLDRDPREITDVWGRIASADSNCATVIQSMRAMLSHHGHFGLLEELKREIESDLDLHKAVTTTLERRERHRQAGMPPAPPKSHSGNTGNSRRLDEWVPVRRAPGGPARRSNQRSTPAAKVVGTDSDGVLLVDLGDGCGATRADKTGGPPLGQITPQRQRSSRSVDDIMRQRDAYAEGYNAASAQFGHSPSFPATTRKLFGNPTTYRRKANR